MPANKVDILMYHAIGRGTGPTFVDPATFKMQMELIVESGAAVVSLDEIVAWRAGAKTFPGRAIALTFDDGFADFADTAYPIIAANAFPAAVFLPTERIGSVADWPGASRPHRPLLSWTAVRALAEVGIDFGGHGATHCPLVDVHPIRLQNEIEGVRKRIEDETGRSALHFAPPFGRADLAAKAMIARTFASSCGTRLAPLDLRCDLHDLPRIEMWYFRDHHRWRAYLASRNKLYFTARQVLRSIRSAIKSI